ncbi:MAG TPA: lysylphosphatidylglycerol synthase domain-containing protein [Gemmatimonadales bacterium]|nr:lysylphosphatidylglycerol synthase domain-containing protein [Gemmatimonadales bacterium]
MSRRARVALLLVGTALFVFLLLHLGPGRLLQNLRETGWMLAPIVAVYAAVYACYALACWLVMADQPGRPPYARTWAIMISGFALNSVTPVVQLGGEPFKIGALTSWLGPRPAAGTVLTYYMLTTLSNMLTWLLAIVLVLSLFRPAAPVALGLAVAAATLAGLVVFVFSRHRAGIFGLALAALSRLPLLRRAARALEGRRDTLMQLDEQIAGFYHRSPVRFFVALAIDFAGRAIGMLEYYLVARSVGASIGFLQAFLMGSFITLGLNLLFFVPFDLGSREGGTGLIFGVLGLPSSLGIYAGIVTRLRWAVWIAVGLALLPVASGRRSGHAAAGAVAGRGG